MSGVPYTFGTATTSIPLSNLDSNFVTPVTIGNASVALGNTITTIGNLTLTNPTIIGGTSNISSTSITNGTSNVAVLSSNSNVTSYVNGVLQSTLFSSGLSLVGSLNSINTFGFKNRIINGAMVIDQRNAGASVTPTSGTYTLDRYVCYLTQASKFTVQQNAGAVTPPTGYSNYLGVTSSSAYSVTSTDEFNINQPIEGFNFADMAWGTANAKTVTLSFQVRSSLTGTFGGCLRNSAGNRSYPFSYSIPTANTWTTISITIAGDTSGTWIGATNGIGVYLTIGLGNGTTTSNTAGAWVAGNYTNATGAVSVVGTSGATFYITGVQLEVGSSATGFDYRPYGTELALCQRYLPAYNFTANNQTVSTGQANAAGTALYTVTYPVQTRTAATGITVTGTFNSSTAGYGNAGNFSSITLFTSSTLTGIISAAGGSGLVAGNATQLLAPSGNSQILFTGCEL